MDSKYRGHQVTNIFCHHFFHFSKWVCSNQFTDNWDRSSNGHGVRKKSSSNSLQTVHGMTSTQRWKELLIHLSYIWLFDAYYLFYLQAAVNFNVFFFFLLFQALSCTIIHADQTNVEFKSWMKTFVKPTDLESMSMKIPRK